MKILHVINRFVKADGGPPQGLLAIAKAQSELGDDVIVFPATNTGGEKVLVPGRYGRMQVIEPPSSRSLILPDAHLDKALIEFIISSDIVHIHGSWRYHLISAAKLALKYNKPYIIRPAGNLGRIPRSHKMYFKIPYFNIFEKKYFQRADAIHCCTQKECEEINDLGLKTDFIRVYQPLDETILKYTCDDEELYRLCTGTSDKSKILFYLGRISWIKQIPLLIDAFALLQKKLQDLDIHLIIAGPCEDSRILNNPNMSLLKGRIHFPGMITDNIKASFLHRADIFVQPSHHENFGMSVVEALAFGKPCIVNSGVALASEILKYRAGAVFNNNISELTECILKLLNNAEAYKEMSENALRLSIEFRQSLIAKQLKEYYQQIIDRRKGRDAK
jgi:glycosyltransferase involved in cell wall biosynthesis